MSNNIERILQTAIDLHRSGRMVEAEAIYRQILAAQPDHTMANHNLGVIYVQTGRTGEALSFLQKAVVTSPHQTVCWQSYAQCLLALGQHAEAREAVHAALQHNKNHPQLLQLEQYIASLAPAQNTPGMDGARAEKDTANTTTNVVAELATMLDAGRFAEVDSRLSELLAHQPGMGKLWHIKGLSLLMRQRYQDALAPLLKAVELLPEDINLLWQLGKCYALMGQHVQALDYYRRALEREDKRQDILLDAAQSALMARAFTESQAFAKRVLALSPENVVALMTLGMAIRHGGGGREESMAAFRKAVALQPNNADAHYNLGVALFEDKNYEAALDSFEHVLLLQPDHLKAHKGAFESNVWSENFKGALAAFSRWESVARLSADDYQIKLFALNYMPDMAAENIFAEYQEFERRFAQPFYAQWKPHTNILQPEKRLRVGYVSGDFRGHSAQYFIEPLLASHDHSRIELWIYSEVSPAQEDGVTARLRELTDHWVPIHGLDDGAVAERIRADGIDILVDLSGHTTGNRLSVFARKPAPVSVSWLGYGYTTGLRAIDWFLTDEVTTPQGYDHLFAEKPFRLPRNALVYRPSDGMGEVGSLPAVARGHVTFGSLTRPIRLNDRVIRRWAEILRRVSGARLILDNRHIEYAHAQKRLIERFERYGVSPAQLIMGFTTPPWDVLRGMDITLDCFPHNSGTTLFESAYMGVPFITLKDRPSVGRLGTSIATALGHPEWSADSEEEYIEKAVAMASDLEGLARLRATLRGEMEASPLMDEKGFARRVEEAYRQMWRQYCSEAGGKA